MAGTIKWVVRLEAVFEDGRASVITEIGEITVTVTEFNAILPA
jgi:hypothetical protein